MPLFSSLYHTFNASTTCCYFSICYRQGGFSSPDTSTERGPFNLAERIFEVGPFGDLVSWFLRVLWKATFLVVKGCFHEFIAIVHRGLSDMLADRFVQRQYQRIRTIIFDCAYTYSITTISLLWTSYELSVLLQVR